MTESTESGKKKVGTPEVLAAVGAAAATGAWLPPHIGQESFAKYDKHQPDIIHAAEETLRANHPEPETTPEHQTWSAGKRKVREDTLNNFHGPRGKPGTKAARNWYNDRADAADKKVADYIEANPEPPVTVEDQRWKEGLKAAKHKASEAFIDKNGPKPPSEGKAAQWEKALEEDMKRAATEYKEKTPAPGHSPLYPEWRAGERKAMEDAMAAFHGPRGQEGSVAAENWDKERSAIGHKASDNYIKNNPDPDTVERRQWEEGLKADQDRVKEAFIEKEGLRPASEGKEAQWEKAHAKEMKRAANEFKQKMHEPKNAAYKNWSKKFESRVSGEYNTLNSYPGRARVVFKEGGKPAVILGAAMATSMLVAGAVVHSYRNHKAASSHAQALEQQRLQTIAADGSHSV